MKLTSCLAFFRRSQRGSNDGIAEEKADRPGSGAGSNHSTLAVSGKSSGASTPNAEHVRADAFVTEVLGIYARLKDLESLAPGNVVNESLSRLVSMCCEIMPSSTVKRILDNLALQAILPRLREICGTAECELEAHWARRFNTFSATPTPEETFTQLGQFPYYSNYTELTRLELCAMCTVTPRQPRRIAFIGSGPLPLTSFTLLRALRRDIITPAQFGAEFNVFHDGRDTMEGENSDITVLNVDINPSAIDASRTLSGRLGKYGKGMEFCVADAGSWNMDLSEFDVVYLAALVGLSSEDKASKVEGIASKMRPGALIVVRSCNDLKLCLYPEIDLQTESLIKRLEICAIVHPYGQVVNSAIIARVK